MENPFTCDFLDAVLCVVALCATGKTTKESSDLFPFLIPNMLFLAAIAAL